MFGLIWDQPPLDIRLELAIERRDAEYAKEEFHMRLDCTQKAVMEESRKKSHEAIFMECLFRGRDELKKKYSIPEPKGTPCKNCHPAYK